MMERYALSKPEYVLCRTLSKSVGSALEQACILLSPPSLDLDLILMVSPDCLTH